MMTKCLFLFKEFGEVPGMAFPSMKDYFQKEPYPDKDKIVAYMKKGRKTYCATSYARDCYTGDRIPGEHCGMTDGEYSWNNELIYYVEKYNLKLDDDFEKKVLRQ